MLTTKELFKIATNELIKLFGKEYLKANFENTCQSSGMIGKETFFFFVGIKDSKDLPNRKANDKGWVVYAKILVDAVTGDIKEKDYVLE